MSWIAELGVSWPFAFASGALIGGAAILWLYVAINRTSKKARAVTDKAVVPTVAQEIADAPLPAIETAIADGFNYPYRKAVLQASISKPRGTLEALAGQEPHKMIIVLRVSNAHHSAIPEWRASVEMLFRDDEELGVRGDLKGSGPRMTKGGFADLPLITRDISDTVSRPPFLLRLLDRDVPLKENAQYSLSIYLRSPNPADTLVMIAIKTGKDLECEATIVHQSV